jgi:hemerythrin
MLELKYPLIEEQREQHRWFVDRLDQSSLSFGSDTKESLDELYGFLREWYVEHILKKDRLIGLSIREKA